MENYWTCDTVTVTDTFARICNFVVHKFSPFFSLHYVQRPDFNFKEQFLSERMSFRIIVFNK